MKQAAMPPCLGGEESGINVEPGFILIIMRGHNKTIGTKANRLVKVRLLLSQLGKFYY